VEFQITSSLDTLRNQQITANFEAVAAWLDEELAPYAGMVVTEEMIPTAKTYRANLRKVKDRIEQYRKEAKTAALAPYNEFEQKCKVLTGKLDEAADNIDGQVKAFEQKEKAAKVAELQGFYLSVATDETMAYCPWDKIFNPKWENKGYSTEDAKEEIKAAIFYTESDLKSIRDIGGDDTPYLLDVYKQTRDLNAVVRKSMEIKAAREREEQRKREEEERRRAAEAQKAAREAEAVEKAAEASHEPVVQKPAPKDDVVTVDFRVTCRRSQLQMLGQYMRQAGIRYGRISD